MAKDLQIRENYALSSFEHSQIKQQARKNVAISTKPGDPLIWTLGAITGVLNLYVFVIVFTPWQLLNLFIGLYRLSVRLSLFGGQMKAKRPL